MSVDSTLSDLLLRLESWSALPHEIKDNVQRLKDIMVALKDWYPVGMDGLALAGRCMEWIDEAMLELKDLNDQDRNLKPKLVSQVIHTQRSLGKVLNRLPGSTALPEDLVTTAGDEPAIHGGFSQVRRGRYGHREVAVKSLPLPTDGDPVKIRKIWKAYCAEALVWKYLIHPNVVPFMGVSDVIPMSLVSLWMPNGTVINYLRADSLKNRLDPLLDIATGLTYLHVLGIVHSDLKGKNVLVGADGTARLTDFGISQIIHQTTGHAEPSTATAGGTYNFMAPELLRGGARATRKSDVYSLGCLFWEIFTLSEPFSGVYEHGVLMNLDEGVRPPRPSAGEAPELSDHLWDTIQRCWDAKPGRRPDAKHVWGVIEGIKELKNFPSVTARLAEKSSSLQPLSSFRMQEQPALVPSGPSHHFREASQVTARVLYRLSPSGQRIIYNGANSVEIHDMCPVGISSRVIRRAYRAKPAWVIEDSPFSFSTDGRLWAEFIGDDKHGCSLVQVRPCKTSEEEYPPIMTAVSRKVCATAFAPDGDHLVVFCIGEHYKSDCFLHIYNIHTGSLVASTAFPMTRRSWNVRLSVTPDGAFAILCHRLEIVFFNLWPLELRLRHVDANLSAFAPSVMGFPEDFRWIQNMRGTLVAYRQRAGAELTSQIVNENSHSLGAVFSPDKKFLAAYDDYKDLGVSLYTVTDESIQLYRRLHPRCYLRPNNDINMVEIVFPSGHDEFLVCSNGEITRFWHIPSGAIVMETDNERPILSDQPSDQEKYDHFLAGTPVPQGWIPWLIGR